MAVNILNGLWKCATTGPELVRCGTKVFLETWEGLNPPSPFGEQIYVNPQELPKTERVFKKIFHGTTEKVLDNQHLKGKFDAWGRPIFVSYDPRKAAFYVKDTDNPVLLELASSGPVKNDMPFHEWYFPAKGHSPQKVHIVRAWKVSEKHIYFLFHQKYYSRAQKAVISLKETWKAVKELKNKE